LLEDSYYIKDGIYLSKEKAKELEVNGINYRMNFYYEIKNGIRFFKKKDVVYVDNKTLEFGSILYDKEEDKVVDLIGD
jgi:CRISPR-associated protein Cas5t